MTHRGIGLSLIVGLSLGLSACGEERHDVRTMLVAVGPVTLEAEGRAEIASVRPTSLRVPGSGWASREIEWMATEGSYVATGDLIAKFKPDESRYQLSQALLEIERFKLERSNKEDEISAFAKRIQVDLAANEVQLAVAERYANADLSYMSRVDLLNAVEDRDLLLKRRDMARMRLHSLRQRGDAELALLDAQLESRTSSADQRRADLQAMELRAPHNGIVTLARDWSGVKPLVGTSLIAGQEYGSLADTSALKVSIEIPLVDAAGIKIGDVVELTSPGTSLSKAVTHIDWISKNPSTVQGQGPAKYVAMTAALSSQTISDLDLFPGMRIRANVILLRSKNAMMIPNLAIEERDGKMWVDILIEGRRQAREVRIGVRDAARSQVLSGVTAGEWVFLDDEDGATRRKQ